MNEIPLTFEFQGKQYKGQLDQVMGGGSSADFHLTVNNRYWGQLSYNQGHPGFNDGLHAVQAGWSFSSNVHPALSELSEYFGSIVASWLDSR